MSAISEAPTFEQLLNDTRPDSELSHDEIIARNLEAVAVHFHNENPVEIDKAIAMYADDISWEAPSRGQVDDDPAVIRSKYIDIFKSWKLDKTVHLRRFATEDFVFDDEIIHCTLIEKLVPNLQYEVGDKVSCRLVHLFEMRDGRIAKEIAYEVWRLQGSPHDHDAIPENATESRPPSPA